jgi:hypothetical protein
MRTRTQYRLDRVEVQSLVQRRGAKLTDRAEKNAYSSKARPVDNSNPLLGAIRSFSPLKRKAAEFLGKI